MYWKKPHISKVYEALTAIADDRIVIDKDNPDKTKCYSSSGNKYYTVTYDPESEAIMSNDNSAFYTDSLSYPMIAFFMLKGMVGYPKDLPDKLKGIHWKDINQKHKNNYDHSIKAVLVILEGRGVNVKEVKDQIKEIYEDVIAKDYKMLGKKQRPPKGY
ncbi:hypothetical protein GF389_04750 [Candidatus Dojkabacteria bacterium]|nr:hypothetical protein [Candidatus Dojkabacteria bacterium]